jgi:hypothetical protein
LNKEKSLLGVEFIGETLAWALKPKKAQCYETFYVHNTQILE